MVALGTGDVAEADEAMDELKATGEEERVTDEGEVEVGLGFDALPSVLPMPAHMNATELNSTRARHILS